MISFDVASLFTNVPLEDTINIILDRIYTRKELNIKIKRNQLKKLLYLCTKNVHFTFDGKMYLQIDGVAMGSPLGPVLANIFMVEFERTIVPSLQDSVKLWRRYVDDTFAFVRKEDVDKVLHKLNGYHQNISFTYETESNASISFLDIKVHRQEDGTFETSVYRKPTNTDLYLHWQSYAPEPWKVGTLKTLIYRAHNNCSSVDAVKTELEHIRRVFIEINGYPKRLVNNIITREHNNFTARCQRNEEDARNDEEVDPEGQSNDIDEPLTPNVMPVLKLPYAGQHGNSMVKRLKSCLNSVTPQNVNPRVVFTSRKLSSFFSLKDKTEEKHLHDLVYDFHCGGCQETYIGETGRRFEKRIHEHLATDKKSHVYKHVAKTGHLIDQDNFKIISSGHDSYKKRRISEALYIHQRKPTLNKQSESVPLKLFI